MHSLSQLHAPRRLEISIRAAIQSATVNNANKHTHTLSTHTHTQRCYCRCEMCAGRPGKCNQKQKMKEKIFCRHMWSTYWHRGRRRRRRSRRRRIVGGTDKRHLAAVLFQFSRKFNRPTRRNCTRTWPKRIVSWQRQLRLFMPATA